MSLDSQNPLYREAKPDWDQLRDTYKGQRAVKEAGFLYLPPTAGMIEDGITKVTSDGFKAYDAYRKRARFVNLNREAVESMLGVMHHKPPVITLPARMEALLERATLRNESLPMLLRRINEEQLITGRVGAMLEVPATLPGEGPPLPLIALYKAEDLINWDEGTRDENPIESLNLVVIEETEEERQENFEWEEIEKHRVLVLGDPEPNEPSGAGFVYRQGVFREGNEFNESELITPSIAGRTLDEIPFKFINTKDVVPDPDEGPLLDLSNLALTIYRASADYRQSLFMQGQDTFVTIGTLADNESGGPLRLGANSHVAMTQDGDAKFVGVESAGLEEQRLAIQNDLLEGKEKAGALLEAASRSAESGEALRIRVAARTASLNQIALAGAFGLQELLRIAAKWLGLNPEEVIIEPNLDFVADIMAGMELVQLMTAKTLGAPLSLKSIHELMMERGITQLIFDDEIKQMMEEAEQGLSSDPTEQPESETANPEDDAPPGEGQESEEDEESTNEE